jgi:hypothetical protein
VRFFFVACSQRKGKMEKGRGLAARGEEEKARVSAEISRWGF